jgi:hypothetical protein
MPDFVQKSAQFQLQQLTPSDLNLKISSSNSSWHVEEPSEERRMGEGTYHEVAGGELGRESFR